MQIKTIEEDDILRTSNDICIKRITKERSIVWNRFIPKIIFANNDTIKLLKLLENNNRKIKELSLLKKHLKKLFSHHLLLKSNSKSFRDLFIEDSVKMLNRVRISIYNKHKLKLPYTNLTFLNSKCNFKCNYCISKYVWKNIKNDLTTFEEKLKKIFKIIDKFFENNNVKTEKGIHFNGGEILLEFQIIKEIVKYIDLHHSSQKVHYSINTNGSLITKEIALFLKNYSFRVSISIDGYREFNNRTRRYKNNQGAFDDIIRGLELLNKYFPERIKSFQGTINDFDNLDFEKIYDMSKYGFQSARLGVNLLNLEVKSAKEFAKKHMELILDSYDKPLIVNDDYLDYFKNAIKYNNIKFTFACNGLTNIGNNILYYNLDKDSVHTICSFVYGTQVSMKEIDNDIYNRLISDQCFNFIKNRINQFFKICIDCEIVGACRGGCVTSGIDSFNNKNEAACAFKKEAWNIFLKYLYINKYSERIN